MQIFYYLIFILVIVPYFLLCFSIPFIKFGKTETCKGKKIYIVSDYVHADYIIESKYFNFITKKKYLKIGWGDRKIFLETKSWNKLKFKDIIGAFFGLNKTVLRVQFLDKIPKNSKTIELNKKQLDIILSYIKKSHNGKLIKKKKEYHQIGSYYESNLKYNCITNCNNWINKGLREAKISNRLWCPLSIYFTL